jgi:signal peptidase I
MELRSMRTNKMQSETVPAKAAPVERRGKIAEWAVTILLLLFGTATLAQAFVIPTGSMEDTLLIGDHVLVDKLAYAPSGPISRYLLPYQEPKHGDIIVFRDPVDISQTLVKRLIGAPGDRLKISNGAVYRNGVRLNEPYVYHKYGYSVGFDDFPGGCCLPVKEEISQQRQRDMLTNHVVNGEIVVPPGMYFGMGDNRDNSYDSRFWGFIPRENIVGKPVLIYWSYRASTEELLASSPGAMLTHMVDVAQHFATRTRWERTFRLIHGFPDSELPDHELPINQGSPNP